MFSNVIALQAMEPIAALLYEGCIFPTSDIKKIVNFSTSFLQKKVQNGQSHLVEIYWDFFELLSAYDILMCDGLTAFRNTLQGCNFRNSNFAAVSVASMKVLKLVF